MELFVTGLNHQSAELEIRERFAIHEDRLGEFLSSARQLPHVEGILALSTCNRVELYGASRRPRLAKNHLLDFLAQTQGWDGGNLANHTYFYQGTDAVHHAMKVASSLDSLILGETQILGQVKRAYQKALEMNATGQLLNKFFHKVMSTAKRVRNETAIGAYPISVSYAAVSLVKQIFGDLNDKKALMIGVGKMGVLALKHLKRAGVKTIYICNRSEERIQDLAGEFGGEVIPFANFDQWLPEVDLVITSTKSRQHLIKVPMVERVIRHRRGKPVFFIDIAVPRNISPDINRLSDVFLYDVDDLGAVVEANKKERLREAVRAQAIIEEEVKKFSKVLESFQKIVPPFPFESQISREVSFDKSSFSPLG